MNGMLGPQNKSMTFINDNGEKEIVFTLLLCKERQIPTEFADDSDSQISHSVSL